ncbi:MAG: 4'-phosphopantetheinyl transferase superfamily protein, partial [Acidobacteriia bacterium]|nr:4'-phosphopantetheinyl transferase superfamily protein [Terriglobia bacterium]
MRSTGFEQSLHDGACHLWHWRPAAFEGRLRERALSFLSPEELARHSRYLVPQPGRTFLAARVFLRSVLSIYHPLPPRSWQFETNPWGRPRVTNLGPRNRFDFNLSHKPGQVTCLVGYGRDLGVDVEDAAANRPYLFDIADRFFSSSEAAGLRALPPPNQLERFYELWTLKESYIKARGIGLSL